MTNAFLLNVDNIQSGIEVTFVVIDVVLTTTGVVGTEVADVTTGVANVELINVVLTDVVVIEVTAVTTGVTNVEFIDNQ